MEIVPDLATFLAKSRAGGAVPLRVDSAADTETPVSAFLKVARGHPHAFLFESVEQGEQAGRWSFLGVGGRVVYRWAGPAALGPDPMAWMRVQLARSRAKPDEGLPPFAGGWVGYLAYDAMPLFEPRVPVTKPDEHGFPAALFMETEALVAFDALRHRAHVIAYAVADGLASPRSAYAAAAARILRTVRRLRGPLRQAPAPSMAPPSWESRVSRRAFKSAVERAKEYIRAGDCQQIVLSQRFDARTRLKPFEVYRALRRINPSPYLFFVQAGSHALVGSSPETLVRVRSGEITVRPIAGTRPRGANEVADARNERELRADIKENAEHVMLVDLGRNDVGRVARVGSVQVERYKDVERYSHVMHLVSEVRGQLAPGRTALDALQAGFPAGTVTGSPKVRAMQIIDELEPARRGPYAGCVGYFDRCGNMETAIAIRTLAFNGGRVSLQAGAGIVYDSDAEREYQETLHKSRALKVAIEEAARGRP